MAQVRTRFAPSPTGYMHVGNLRTALYAYLTARHEDGVFCASRITARFVEGATEMIYDTLKEWLELGRRPRRRGDYGPYVQSERMGLFKDYALELVKKGKAYCCFCTPERIEKLHKEQIAAGESVGRYDGHCRDLPQEEVERRLAANEPHVIRQKAPTEGSALLTT